MLRAILLILSLVCRLKSALGRAVPGVSRQLPEFDGSAETIRVRLWQTRDEMIAPRVIIISMVWAVSGRFQLTM